MCIAPNAGRPRWLNTRKVSSLSRAATRFFTASAKNAVTKSRGFWKPGKKNNMPQTQSQPRNWQRVRLGDVANVLPGFAFKSSEFKKDGDIPVVKIKNITDNLNVSI